jgi:hypothetical protein
LCAAGLALLIAGSLVADRVAAHLAGDRIAARLGCVLNLADPLSVSVAGFPFVTQLSAGRYAHVRVSGSNLRRGGLTVARGQADLYESVVATGAGMEVTIGGRDLTTPATRATGAGPHTDHCGGN